MELGEFILPVADGIEGLGAFLDKFFLRVIEEDVGDGGDIILFDHRGFPIFDIDFIEDEVLAFLHLCFYLRHDFSADVSPVGVKLEGGVFAGDKVLRDIHGFTTSGEDLDFGGGFFRFWGWTLAAEEEDEGKDG